MALAIAPLVVSAVLGYFILKQQVMEPFVDVMARERNQVGAMQRLQLQLRSITEPVDLYADASETAELHTYRSLRQQIELSFANLREEFKSDDQALNIVNRARADWSAADRLGTEIISVHRPPGDPHVVALIEEFGGRISAAVDKLSAANDKLRQEVGLDYDDAHHAYERSEWIAGIAAFITFLLVVSGVFTIGRMIVSNVDRLVEGAVRFSEGDFEYQINIEVPKELHRVADEFNRMSRRIRETELTLAQQARHDSLTGLLNRRSFDQALGEALGRMNRLDEQFALCFIDIDRFKVVNDTYGHGAGDSVLRAVGHAMTASMREIDKVFRIGGEEFAIILPGAVAETALRAAERLRSLIASSPIGTDQGDIAITMSMGVTISWPGCNAKKLMEVADLALYQAKSEGRNCVRLSDPPRMTPTEPSEAR